MRREEGEGKYKGGSCGQKEKGREEKGMKRMRGGGRMRRARGRKEGRVRM